ncbi:sugar transport protein 14-like [Eucalyptus grandis]|uniref:sugar transport protein 14-like n=1 Tax=Eucalyptus grandis TaxID=71139 RepID=UPI00192EAF31|nr:sugar transport protein 14-like [Eucalyptus grandis]
MVGGGFVEGGQLRRAHLYEYRITGYFVFACIIAAHGGSLFGYDLGVSDEANTSAVLYGIRQREMVESCRWWTVRSSPKRPDYPVAWMIPG